MNEEAIEETQDNPAPEPLPTVRCVAEDYNADNPDHYAQWVLSGRPQLPWQATFYEDLQPDGTYIRRPQEQPPEPPPVTDVNSPIPSILKGYDESEAARAERVKLLKSTTSYALGSKIGADLAAANPPTNAEELAALKAEAKGQASALGGAFFDSYFSWIGAYREGGGPGFLAAVQADTSTAFLDWPTPPNGITLPDGTIVLAEGGVVRDLFTHFLS